MARTFRLSFGAFAVGFLFLGCGGEPGREEAKPTGPDAATSGKPAPPKTEHISLDSLPPVGDPLPVVDDGRVQLRLPKGWSLLPRSKNYLIGGRLREDAKYPQVLLTAESAAGGPQRVTVDNVVEFTQATQREIQQGVGVFEDAVPVQIGEFVGARYAKRGKSGDLLLERMFLVTVVDGRKYLVELRALEGTLTGFRKFGETVAGHLNFSPEADGTLPKQ